MIPSVRVDPGINHGFNGGSSPKPVGTSSSGTPNSLPDIFPEIDQGAKVFTQSLEGENVTSLNEAARFFQNKLEFRYDNETGRIVTRVVDRNSGEEVKQIPSQDALDAAFRLEKLKGVLFDETN